jgi:hypothetical protein
VRSRQLESALHAFIEEAAFELAKDTASGAEVPFEIVAQPSRAHRTPLYCYRPLTGEFIRERADTLARLPTYVSALALVAGLDGLDRYLVARGATHAPVERRELARAALRALLDDVFDQQTDFALRPERVREALKRMEQAAVAGAEQVVVVATLHGLAIASAELALTRGLLLAQADAVRGAPEEATLVQDPASPHLLIVLTSELPDHEDAIGEARAVLADLLRALRLFGDGRVSLGPMAWSRAGANSWRPLVLSAGGRPRGMLVVASEQEDELRAFCNLVSRRAPHANELAWALARFEMGCERAVDHEALSDYLLALRVLLEPEGSSSGLLPGRLAALCAVPERRTQLAERVTHAVALERSIIAGTAPARAGADALVAAMGDHLRALLRDVICGHLDADLDRVADELIDAELDDEELDDEELDDVGDPSALTIAFHADEVKAPGTDSVTLQQPRAEHEPNPVGGRPAAARRAPSAAPGVDPQAVTHRMRAR